MLGVRENTIEDLCNVKARLGMRFPELCSVDLFFIASQLVLAQRIEDLEGTIKDKEMASKL